MNTMSLNHNFLVLVQNFCTWSLLHSSLSLFLLYALLLFIIMLQYTMRVSIFRFPSLILNCLIYALKLPTNINAFLVLQTRAGRSRSDYNLLVRLSLTITFKFGASNLQNFLNNVSCAQNVLWLPHARLTLAMLLHHTPSLENFHGLLSMSSRMVCPCF
jgi:hypothetical protein